MKVKYSQAELNLLCIWQGNIDLTFFNNSPARRTKNRKMNQQKMIFIEFLYKVC